MSTAAYQRKWRRENPKKQALYQKRWHAKNPKRGDSMRRKWWVNYRDRLRVEKAHTMSLRRAVSDAIDDVTLAVLQESVRDLFGLGGTQKRQAAMGTESGHDTAFVDTVNGAIDDTVEEAVLGVLHA